MQAANPALPCGFVCEAAKNKAKDTIGDAASSVAGDALRRFADAVKEAVGEAVASLGTIWVRVKSPDLTGDGSGMAPGTNSGPGAQGIVEVLSWVAWVTFGLCVLSLMLVGVRMAIDSRRGSGQMHVTRIGTILVATLLVSAAAGLTTEVMAGRSQGSSTVAFIQDSLWYYTAAAVVLSIIVAAARMVWEQRAEPGKDLVRSLLTLTLVSGAGLAGLNLLIAAGDEFSLWILNSSLECDLRGDSTCFGENMTILLGLAQASGGLGVMAVIILGLMAFGAAIAQVALMIARSGMLVLLAGIWPLAASATNTETGRNMFKKTTAWLIAFLLYKPAAAIVYATAFRLAGSDVFGGGTDALWSVVIGLVMMILAVLTLPSLMRLVTSAVGTLTAGNLSGGMAMAAAAAVPTGAIAAGKLMGGGDSDGSGSAPSGASGASGPSGSPASDSPSGSGGSAGGPRTDPSGGSNSGGSAGGPRTDPSGGSNSGGSVGGPRTDPSGGSNSGGSAGGAAAAAGPVGLALAAGWGSGGGASGWTAAGSVAGKTVNGLGAVGAVGAEGAGEEGGPSGSR